MTKTIWFFADGEWHEIATRSYVDALPSPAVPFGPRSEFYDAAADVYINSARTVYDNSGTPPTDVAVITRPSISYTHDSLELQGDIHAQFVDRQVDIAADSGWAGWEGGSRHVHGNGDDGYYYDVQVRIYSNGASSTAYMYDRDIGINASFGANAFYYGQDWQLNGLADGSFVYWDVVFFNVGDGGYWYGAEIHSLIGDGGYQYGTRFRPYYELITLGAEGYFEDTQESITAGNYIKGKEVEWVAYGDSGGDSGGLAMKGGRWDYYAASYDAIGWELVVRANGAALGLDVSVESDTADAKGISAAPDLILTRVLAADQPPLAGQSRFYLFDNAGVIELRVRITDGINDAVTTIATM